MKILKLAVATLGVLALSSCGKANVSCSDDGAKEALEAAIREGLEKVAVQRVISEDGSQPISTSSIRAAIASMKLVLDNIRTTKEDPDSTKKFCTGNLKIVFSPETFASADKARQLVNMSNVQQMAESADVEKGADYLKSDFDYNVQPTDDGTKIFAEFENATSKLDVFGEVIAASLLKNRIENQIRSDQEQAATAEREKQAALNSEKTANLEQAHLALRTADQALNAAWQALDPTTRQELLAQQKIWIKRKDSSCKVQSIQSSNEPQDQKINEINCKASWSNERIQQIQGYIGQ